jgi:hypothetical protein
VIDVSANPSAQDSLCIANPTLAHGGDGLYYMLYKTVGRQKPLPFGGAVVHLIATSKSPIGPFKKELNPLLLVPGETFPFEDPFMWFDAERARFFCIMKARGCNFGSGARQTYNVRIPLKSWPDLMARQRTTAASFKFLTY